MNGEQTQLLPAIIKVFSAVFSMVLFSASLTLWNSTCLFAVFQVLEMFSAHNNEFFSRFCTLFKKVMEAKCVWSKQNYNKIFSFTIDHSSNFRRPFLSIYLVISCKQSICVIVFNQLFYKKQKQQPVTEACTIATMTFVGEYLWNFHVFCNASIL